MGEDNSFFLANLKFKSVLGMKVWPGSLTRALGSVYPCLVVACESESVRCSHYPGSSTGPGHHRSESDQRRDGYKKVASVFVIDMEIVVPQ